MKKVLQVLVAIWQIFLHEKIRDHNSYKFSSKVAFIPFFFLRNQKQEPRFQLGRLVRRSISVVLQSHAKFNSLLWRNFTCHSCSYYSFRVYCSFFKAFVLLRWHFHNFIRCGTIFKMKNKERKTYVLSECQRALGIRWSTLELLFLHFFKYIFAFKISEAHER